MKCIWCDREYKRTSFHTGPWCGVGCEIEDRKLSYESVSVRWLFKNESVINNRGNRYEYRF